jgi:hypothetical protein
MPPQYFKQELFFRPLNDVHFFYIPEQKGPLVISVIKHIHNNTGYEASAHSMHVIQLLTAYSVCFPPGKEMALLEMCKQL